MSSLTKRELIDLLEKSEHIPDDTPVMTFGSWDDCFSAGVEYRVSSQGKGLLLFTTSLGDHASTDYYLLKERLN